MPASFLMLSTMLLPVIIVMLLSFTNYELGMPDTGFVGIDNYVSVLGDAKFWHVLRNTVIYTLLVVPGSVIGGLFLAVLVQSVGKGRRIYQCLFFLPVTATLVAMATVWKYLLHGQIGPINQLLHGLGLPQMEFFGDPGLVLISLAIIGIWQLAGFNMVLFIAGLVAIPEDLYDAARVDGADRPWDRFFTVTLPLLGPTMLFVIVTSSITAFKVFDTVAVLTRGGPQAASEVILYQIYLEGFQYLRTGSAAAMTVLFLACILVLSWLQTRLTERKVHYV
ncbi:binding-protein-dependent transport system inner membrane protein [Advenella kashmirensis WT001]|uniref:Binding-protein-dependent transport system inner membrane protein n=1 Tax=Advenella kashmirensis (strain DSM 17095 / LMG 22695 / WT001) TaxID=1036672 RepID=I3UFR0_ADVKW|nr:sugar ABC transporter permease [Advenella kashmirensis]AFK63848.1 binding-protein-dependent transport system inner membrane protein [Advenella kashmirensis WT001]